MEDKLGFEIPAHLEAAWTEANKIGRELCNEIQRIYLQIENARAADDLIFREVGQSCVEDLKNAWRALQGVIPYALCPYDKGDPVARLNCPACHERGYLSKFRWNRCCAKDVKAAHMAPIAAAEEAQTSTG